MAHISKTKALLYSIAERMGEQLTSVIDFLDAATDPSLRGEFMHGMDAVRSRRRIRAEKERRIILAALKRQKWVTIQKTRDHLLVALTDRGKMFVQRARMCTAIQCPPRECIMVIFDIPETERHARAFFRHLLKECRFRKMQQSVWVSDYEVLDAVRDFISTTKSAKWISVFRAKDLT